MLKLKHLNQTAHLLLLAFLFTLGCGEAENPDVIKREGEPDYVRSVDDDQMDRAVAKAKQTYMQLVEALDAAAPNHHSFTVKKPYSIPDGGREHIWINSVTWDGEKFLGEVNNEPVDTKEVKLGDIVTITPEELSDWMYIDGNTVVGGYTLRVLHYQMSAEEQKAFEESTGLIIPPVDF